MPGSWPSLKLPPRICPDDTVAEALALCVSAPLPGESFPPYLSVSDDWSTVTPGPIVELMDTF